MRNAELTKNRDRRMVELFYQLYDVKRLRLDDVLKNLSENIFFLSSDYIYKRIFYISENQYYYEQLKGGKVKSSTSSQLKFNFN